ncbi:hypothetical protein N7470_001125 [Penicillium chermesinum]|nr:hypothetical protein N7470_001125 [Penicillium chermesinum]
MAMRTSQQLRSLPSRLLQTASNPRHCIRSLHSKSTPVVPPPTPFVPDVPTFLTLIGRQMSKHASKITSWDQLFKASSAELQELGIEPARQRRYLIRKREKFRNGIYGPGGDLETVVDGVAQLRVVEVPREALPSATSAEAVAGDSESAIAQSKPLASAAVTPGMKRAIVNLLPGVTEYKHEPNTVLKKFLGMKIHRGSQIKGPYLLPVRGSHGRAATISVQEGMWEDKRGHKIDGGERRQREVRAKKELEERRKRA